MRPIENTMLNMNDLIIWPSKDDIDNTTNVSPNDVIDENKAVWITIRGYYWSRLVVTERNIYIWDSRSNNGINVRGGVTLSNFPNKILPITCTLFSWHTIKNKKIPGVRIHVTYDNGKPLFGWSNSAGQMMYDVPCTIFPQGRDKQGYFVGEYIKKRLGGSYKKLLDSPITGKLNFWTGLARCSITFYHDGTDEYPDSELCNVVRNYYVNNGYGDPSDINSPPFIGGFDWNRGCRVFKRVTLSNGEKGVYIYVCGDSEGIMIKC